MNSNNNKSNNSYQDQEFYNVAGAQSLADSYEPYLNNINMNLGSGKPGAEPGPKLNPQFTPQADQNTSESYVNSGQNHNPSNLHNPSFDSSAFNSYVHKEFINQQSRNNHSANREMHQPYEHQHYEHQTCEQQPYKQVQKYSELDTPLSIMSVISLILGLISIIFAFFSGWVTIISAVGGIICSIIALTKIKSQKTRGKGLAIAGLCTSIAGLVIILILFVFTLYTLYLFSVDFYELY